MRNSYQSSVAIFFIWIFFVLNLPASYRLENSSLAVVGDVLVTERDVSARRILQVQLNAFKTSPTKTSETLVVTDSWALSQLVLETVVSKEAGDILIDSKELGADLGRVKSFLGSNKDWQSVGYSDAELEQMLKTIVRSQIFLKTKTSTSAVDISDQEAKSYFEKNRVKFANLPFDQFKDSIKEFLAREASESRVKDWFEVLKRKYRVRFLKGS